MLSSTKKCSFWLKGPERLSTYQESWPDSNFGCLSAASKQLTQHANVSVPFNVNVGPQDAGTLVDIQKYSDLNKLFRVTSCVFKGVNVILKKPIGDPDQSAKLYWVREMQKVCFHKELAYLRNSNNKHSSEVPPLVNNLDLFLKGNDMIRSRGRIGKTLQ